MKIVSEINRMREIMGLRILSETLIESMLLTESGGDDLGKVMGFSPKTYDNMTSAGVKFVDDLSTVSSKFDGLGIKSFSDLKGKVVQSNPTKTIDNITDEDILAYLKTKGIYDDIQLKASMVAKAEADILTKNRDIVAVFKGYEGTLKTINFILGTKIDDLSIQGGLKEDLITYRTEIDNVIKDLKDSGTPVPISLIDLSLQLQAKIDDCNKFSEVPKTSVEIKTKDVSSTDTTTKFGNETANQSKNAGNVKDLFGGNTIANYSFNGDWVPDITKSSLPSLNQLHMNIAGALQAKLNGDPNWTRFIPQKGFEKFGIDDFRDYMKNNLSNIVEADPSTGKWKVEFKKSNQSPGGTFTPKKPVSVFDGGYGRMEFTDEDFEIGKPTISSKGTVKEKITPEEAYGWLESLINKKLNWFKSTEYKRRRMALTNETEQEVDDAVKEIESYLKTIEVKWEFSQDRYGKNVKGDASIGRTSSINPESVVNSVGNKINMQPAETKASAYNTLDHEINHLLDVTTNGGIKTKNKNYLYRQLDNLYIKIAAEYQNILPKITNSYPFYKYVEEYWEQAVRISRLDDFYKQRFGKRKDSKFTDQDIDDIWKEKVNMWDKDQVPPGYSDVKYWFDIVDEEIEQQSKIVGKDAAVRNAKGKLKHILNYSLALAALMSLQGLNTE
jgi:hypothetical protein